MHILGSVRSRMLLAVALMFLPIFVLAEYRAWARRNQDLAVAVERLQLQVDAIATRHADIQRNASSFISALLTDLDVGKFAIGQTCSNAMGEHLAREPVLDNIGLVLPDGQMICNGRNNPPLQMADRAYFQRALRETNSVVGQPVRARASGNWVLPSARGIRDDHGNVVAVMVANVGLPNLIDEFAGFQYLKSARMGVVSADAVVLAHYPDPKRMVGQNVATTSFYQAIVAAGGHGIGEEPGLDDQPRLFAFTRLLEDDAQPVYVWVSFYKDLVTNNADSQFWFSLLLNVTVTLTSFALLWLLWERQILRPLTAIMDAARRLSTGDYQARTGLKQSSDEFGMFARMFDQMAETLASETQVLQLNRALRVLSGCAKNVVQAPDEQQLLDGICRTIVDNGNYSGVWVGYAEHDERGSVRIPAYYGGGLDDAVRNARLTWKEGPQGSGPFSITLRSGQRQVVQDLATEDGPPPASWRKIALDCGYRSVVTLPLQDRDTTFGVIAIFASEPDAFTADELNLLDELAEDIAFGILTRRDAQERQRAEALADHLAKVDAVTELPNRVELIAHLRKHIARTAVSGREVAILSVSIDRLIDIQDVIGLAGVDNVLRQFAKRLSDHVAGIHFVARNSADSLAIVAPVAIEPPASVAASVQALTDMPFEYASIPIDLQITVGAALFPEHGADADALLRHADIAVRRARAAANAFGVYAGGGDSENPQNLILLSGLRKAIRDNQLVLFYQPKISTSSPAVIGAEALVRWKHPEKGMVPPGVFIPLAERTGLIRPLTYWVIGAALQQLAHWQRVGGGTRVAVNVSQYNLRDPDFYEQFIALPAKAGARLDGLDVEITESMLMEDPAHSRALLQRLADLGVRIFIDDFGTGYSSLAYLATLPIHALKIDRSFVIQMHESRYQAIVASTISMAHSLGMKVVAEGVETMELVQALAELGCDEIQGYVYSKPLPAEDFDRWCAQFDKSKTS